MTEQEWLASECPETMLDWLIISQTVPMPSDRKLRLYACACARKMWHLLTDEQSRRAVEVAERYADGEATVEELRDASAAAWDTASATDDIAISAAWTAASNVKRAAAWTVTYNATTAATRAAARAGQANLLRDTLGNLWRSIEFRLEWRTPDVLSIARAAYTDRLGDGMIDQDSLLVLSDALEEVGCDDEVLTALRSPAARYRGFWALDLILGKE